MPTLAQLRILVAVVDRGTFTDAAAALHVSQSAVSHAVAALEREAGGRLVERETPARPTALGARVLPHARAALASADAFVAETAAGRVAGTVRLGAVPTVCQGLLPQLLHHWAQQLPDVQVRVFEGDDEELPQWLANGVVDAAVLVDPDPLPTGALVVARDDFRALLRRDHPLAGEPHVDLADLQDDGILSSPSGCEPQIARIHAAAGLPWAPAQHVRELGTVIRMVAEGIGVSLMPSLGQAMLPAEVVMRPLVPQAVRTLVLTGPTQRPWHPLVHAIVDAAPADPHDARADLPAPVPLVGALAG